MNEVMLESAYKQAEIDAIIEEIKKEVEHSQFIDCKGFMEDIKEEVYRLYAKHEFKED
jgi:nitrogen regulatory protein PII